MFYILIHILCYLCEFYALCCILLCHMNLFKKTWIPLVWWQIWHVETKSLRPILFLTSCFYLPEIPEQKLQYFKNSHILCSLSIVAKLQHLFLDRKRAGKFWKWKINIPTATEKSTCGSQQKLFIQAFDQQIQ